MSKLQQRGVSQFESSLFVLVLNKDHMRPYTAVQFNLSSFGAQRQCCNL